MGNRSRHKSRYHRPPPTVTPLAHVMRTRCPQCNERVRWITVEEAQNNGVDLASALAFFEDAADEVWVCTACDNFGVMGPTEHGTF